MEGPLKGAELFLHIMAESLLGTEFFKKLRTKISILIWGQTYRSHISTCRQTSWLLNAKFPGSDSNDPYGYSNLLMSNLLIPIFFRILY